MTFTFRSKFLLTTIFSLLSLEIQGAPELVRKIPLESTYTTDLKVAHKFDTLAYVSQSRPAHVSAIDLSTGKQIWKHQIDTFIPLFVREAFEAPLLVSAGYHELRENAPNVPVIVLDKNSGQPKKVIETNFQAFRALAVSKDGRVVAGGGGNFVASGDGPNDQFSVWDSSTGVKYFDGNVDGAIYDLSFSADGRTLITVDNYKTKYWDIAQQRLIKEIESRFQVSGGSAFSSSLTYFASNGYFYIKLWDVEEAREVRTLTPGLATSMQFSENNSSLAVGYGSGIIRIWKTHSDDLPIEIKSPTGVVISALAYAAGGKLLVSTGNKDQTIMVWKIVPN